MLHKEPVYIIIPVYNRKETTLACLRHLKTCGDLDRYHIVVVDDGSTDGTSAAIANYYPDVIVLSGDGDLWWTGAIALGMKHAFEKDANYIIWLNDDCLPEPGTLPIMVEFMQSHSRAIVAPGCYVLEGNEYKLVHNGSQGRQSFAASPNEVITVDGMSGWCVGMPALVIKKIGFPDKQKYPHYSGDDMYTLAATRSGFNAYLIGNARATLMGKIHPKVDFCDYFHLGSSPRQTLQSLFFSKKSPYRILTQYFSHVERYGAIFGMFLFCLKLILWINRWLKYQLLLWIHPRIINIEHHTRKLE